MYLLQLGFHLVAVVGKLVLKLERDSYIQKEKQYIPNTKHRIQKQENKQKKFIINPYPANVENMVSS
jgi:hypothetical protein